MKKIFLSILVAAGMLTSCDMDLKPIGSLDDETAIQSINDVSAFRVSLMSSMRGLTTSGFFTYPEIQVDKFNGTIINGNRGGVFANGTIIPGISEIESYWASLYSIINNANFLIEKAEPVIARYEAEEDVEKADECRSYVADARFIRAFCYAELFDRFCTVYSEAKGDQAALGLPLVTVYYPTADRSKYPGRSTMNETLELINADIDYCLQAYETYEADMRAEGYEVIEPMAYDFNSMVVKSLKARLALWIGDYANAKTYANEVINSGYYTLTPRTAYAKMWTSDTSNEIIFMPYMVAPSELSNSIGSRWISSDVTHADYIPSPLLLNMYTDKGKDARYGAFFNTRYLDNNGEDVKVTSFNKFPGNEALKVTTANNLMNKPKVFRLAEMYLIVAEASAALGEEGDANTALDAIRKARIQSYTTKTYTSAELVQNIRDERTKELVGEGFRMSDLRRWKQGFTRDGNYGDAAADNICTRSGLLVSYSSDDYRYTWPIPAGEIAVNPQLAGQQNPGY